MTTDTKQETNELSLTLMPVVAQGALAPLLPGAENRGRPVGAQKSRLGLFFFLGLVVAPFFLAVIYNFATASPRFSSTAAFMVRENQRSGGVLSLVAGNTIGRSDDNSYAISEYLQSRDAVTWLNTDGMLERVFGADNVDLFSRFPTYISGRTKDDLFHHFQSYIDVDFKQSTGVSTLEVQAFTPEDAVALTERLLQGAEALVNTLNQRARADSIREAEATVNEATVELQAIQVRLTAFRNSEGLLDPDAEVSMANKVITGTMEQVAKVDAQLSLLMSTTPSSPAVRQLQNKRDALEVQLAQQREALVGGGDSLAKKMEGYEQVSLQRKLAERTLLSAVASLASAKQNFQGKKIYLARVVEPNLSDRPSQPTRFMNVIAVLVIGLAIFWIAHSMTKLVLEEV
ncbi:hypothetical protein [Ensifer adhaerens]|uniref:hypothetical protein n=1 Tax=Ensifer adhaerens TaxID=106592 RepID=UPI000CF08CB8|nr:hypothetical protein [Ensifer adhaerens]